jgi:hypothetical protein
MKTVKKPKFLVLKQRLTLVTTVSACESFKVNAKPIGKLHYKAVGYKSRK